MKGSSLYGQIIIQECIELRAETTILRKSSFSLSFINLIFLVLLSNLLFLNKNGKNMKTLGKSWRYFKY